MSAPLGGLRVLVVDDDAVVRALLADMLEEEGARVVVAASARAALAIVERDRPDVLVSDIMMPGEDGYWLIGRVRALGPRAGGALPAVAITGDAHTHARARALEAGFDDHLAKPVRIDALAGAVARLARAPARV